MLDLPAQLFDRHVGKHILAARLAGLLECHSRVPHDRFGNSDELAVCPGLPLLALPRRHALDLVHPTPRRTCAIAESLDTPQLQRLGQTANQPRDDAHYVPQQRVVGRMMNVGLHHRGVDPQLRTILQSNRDRRPEPPGY